MDRRRARRAQGAHRRVDVALGRRHAHAQRRPQRLQAAAVHDRAVPHDRGALRTGLLDPPAGRADAGRRPRATRLAAHGPGPRALPRDGPGDHLHRRGQGDVPAARGAVLRRRAVRPGRGPPRPERRHQRLRHVRPPARRRGQPPHVGVRPAPATRRHVGRDHRQGRDPRRAHRQRRRAVGARGRADDRPRAAGARDGAHVPRHRGHGRGRRAQRGDRPRDADGARLRRGDLHPPGGRRDAHGHVRAGVRAVAAADRAVDVRHGAAGAGPRPHRPVAGDRLQALPGDGDRRHQADHQRALHVRSRRQPAGRADPRDPQLLGGVRRHGRVVAGRRRRPGAGQLDDDGRPAAGHLGDGRRPLRRLGQPRLHQRQGARELQPALPHHVPQRGTAGGPPAAHHAGLRPADRAQRGVGRRVRPRAPAVVPASGSRAGRGRHVPAVQRLPGRRRGVPGRARAGRPDGVLELRQVPGDRRRVLPTGCRACSPTACRRSGGSC